MPAAVVSQLLGRCLVPTRLIPIRRRSGCPACAARLYSLTVWPLLWAVGEEVTYLGYALPRLERRYGVGRAAALLSLAWAAQHAVMPVLPGRRYALSRVAAMAPMSVRFTAVCLARGRRLVPLIAALL